MDLSLLFSNQIFVYIRLLFVCYTFTLSLSGCMYDFASLYFISSQKTYHCPPVQEECPHSHLNHTSVQKCITVLQFRKIGQVYIISHFSLKMHHCRPAQKECSSSYLTALQAEDTSLSFSTESVFKFVSYLTSGWRRITVLQYRKSVQVHIVSHFSLKTHITVFLFGMSV
jgi:hypothetical protein